MSSIDICKIPVSTRSFEEHRSDIIDAAFRGNGKIVITLNLEMVSYSFKENSYRGLLDKAALIVADGMPIVWASRLYKNRSPIVERTNGTALVETILRTRPLPRIGVVGGVNPGLALEKAGCRNDAFIFDGKVELTPEAVETLVSELRAEKVQLLFVALGVPKQDKLACELRSRMPELVMINVGGAFDLLAGLKPRAPLWVQNMGCEWLVRLLTEPRRLWRRYLLLYPFGVWSVARDIVRCNWMLPNK